MSGSGLDFWYTSPQPSISNSCATTSCTGQANDTTYIGDYWKSSCTSSDCWNWTSGGGCPVSKCKLGENAWECLSSCGWGDLLEKVWVKINDDDHIPWYQGTGSPSGNQYDLWSVMTHEMGHAAGFTHINSFCGTSSMYTMCSGPGDFKGTNHPRSLSSHEKDDLAAKY